MPKKKRDTTCAPVTPGLDVRVCVTKPATPGETIAGPDDVCRLLGHTKRADRESLYAVHLDSGNRVLGVEEIGRGTIAAVETSPREIFKSALLTNAAAVILAHNHPSGRSRPSADDEAMTRRIIDASKILGVPIRDHIIVSDDGCTSLRTLWGEGKGFGQVGRPKRKKKR